LSLIGTDTSLLTAGVAAGTGVRNRTQGTGQAEACPAQPPLIGGFWAKKKRRLALLCAFVRRVVTPGHFVKWQWHYNIKPLVGMMFHAISSLRPTRRRKIGSLPGGRVFLRGARVNPKIFAYAKNGVTKSTDE